MTVSAISLHQPWASAIFLRDRYGAPLKPDETRSWQTTVRGRILIHAAQKSLRSVVKEIPEAGRLLTDFNLSGMLPLGSLIGSVELSGCSRTEDVRFAMNSAQLRWGNYEPGRFAWHLERPIRFETPIPYTGHQSWFNVGLDEIISAGVGQLHVSMLRGSGGAAGPEQGGLF